MVRFSDMLGGNGEPERSRAATLPQPPTADPPGADEPEPEPDAAATDSSTEATAAAPIESAPAEAPGSGTVPGPPSTAEGRDTPQDVLDRLTQYATSARATDPPPAAPPTATTGAESPAELGEVGDDLLPRAKGDNRKRRRK